jgi:hypothetical protein
MKTIKLTDTEIIINDGDFRKKCLIADDATLKTKVDAVFTHVEGSLTEEETTEKNNKKTQRLADLNAEKAALQAKIDKLS